MRRVIGWSVLLLVLAALAGAMIARDPGYVLLAWDAWSLETSVWFALLASAGLVLLFRISVAALLALPRMGIGVLQWNGRRLDARARARTTEGLLALSEGQFEDAQKRLMHAPERVDAPLLNYLGAARAAQQLGDEKRRDELLALAADRHGEGSIAVDLARAEFSMEAGDHAAAGEILAALRLRAPRHAQLLRMQARVLEALSDWPALIDLVPVMRKSRVLNATQLEAIEAAAWRGELERAAAGATGDEARRAALRERFGAMPRALRRHAVIAATQARLLDASGGGAGAEEVLRDALGQQWDEALVRQYGEVSGADLDAQFLNAQRWLDDHADSAGLRFALARLAVKRDRGARAIEYFEQCVQLSPDLEAWLALAELHAASGDSAAALECIQAMQVLQQSDALEQPRTGS